MHFDVIIIGASFSGMILASLINKDKTVLVIDRKKSVDSTVETTGLITNKTKDYIESKIGSIESALTNQIYSIGVVAPDFEKYFISKVEKPWIYTTNPNRIMKIAKNKAENLCRFEYNTEMKQIERDGEDWLIRTKCGKAFTTKYLIGADGALSQVALQIPELSVNKKFLIGFEKVLKGEILKGEHGKDIFHFWFGELGLGYGGWISPDVLNGQNVVRVGLAIHKDDKDQPLKVKKFINALVKHRWIEIGEEMDYFADLIPVSGYVKDPIFKNACLIGDAAGICGPFAADGIRGAVASASAISLQINHSETLCKKRFYKQIEDETGLIYYIRKQLLYRKVWELFKSNRSFDELYNLCEVDHESFLENYIKSKENKESLIKKLITLKNLGRLSRIGFEIVKSNFKSLA